MSGGRTVGSSYNILLTGFACSHVLSVSCFECCCCCHLMVTGELTNDDDMMMRIEERARKEET